MPSSSFRTVRFFRLVRLMRLRARRRIALLTAPLWRLSTWMFLAAGALVGFEGIELILGGLILAPELVPLVLLALALAWLLRDRLARVIRRLRNRFRGYRRLRRVGRAATPAP